MLQKMTLVFLAVATLTTDNGQDAYKEWIQLMKGEWNYELTNPSEKGSVVYRAANKGTAMTGKFRSADVGPGIELGGWKAKTKTYSVVGYGADGSFWQIDFTSMTPDKAEGSHVSRSGEVEYEGKISLKKVDEDRVEWKSTGKDQYGNEVERTGLFKRKSE